MDTVPIPGARASTPAVAPFDAPTRWGRWGSAWAGLRAAVGALLGLLPHVIHHVGILAGAALLTGVFGNALLYVLGLILSIPLLIRIRRRFGTVKAPAIGVAVFTAMFLVSALVVGPAISGVGGGPGPQTPPTSGSAIDHDQHHGG
ncbi:hypothetical protein [Aestuariimicrobium sp. T2.26MG-19.2B]|uniref:hypothetical protein n=1 Tax=Aestuariimicrobium sp. T2.26MG-19.2B TaxID=3040679 RepID=UPI002477350A|nr:hypothetical protein [Aestuariimicrobium sp. T2.26MG-19.2B]CAI9411498.1 hypothetical protein AESSP_02663 [Aestuariimicrobium sp. T2.26MG-19.2B]